MAPACFVRQLAANQCLCASPHLVHTPLCHVCPFSPGCESIPRQQQPVSSFHFSMDGWCILDPRSNHPLSLGPSSLTCFLLPMPCRAIVSPCHASRCWCVGTCVMSQHVLPRHLTSHVARWSQCTLCFELCAFMHKQCVCMCSCMHLLCALVCAACCCVLDTAPR